MSRMIDIEKAKKIAAQEVYDEDFSREIRRQKRKIRKSKEYRVIKLWSRRNSDGD